MKPGDMIKLNPEFYPREENYVGVLIEKHAGRKWNGKTISKWVVMIKDRIHPYYIDQDDMEIVNESR